MINTADPSGIRDGEVVAPLPLRGDAELVFIGRVRTPFEQREDCPRQGRDDGQSCWLEVDEPWRVGLTGLEAGMRVQVLYWMHLARRDLVLQNPDFRGDLHGTFSIRSPVRPNPIAVSLTTVRGVDLAAGILHVGGLDCVDGTPLLDIKRDRCFGT
jgi:tRNA (adenine37-N6)-methyltransferase